MATCRLVPVRLANRECNEELIYPWDSFWTQVFSYLPQSSREEISCLCVVFFRAARANPIEATRRLRQTLCERLAAVVDDDARRRRYCRMFTLRSADRLQHCATNPYELHLQDNLNFMWHEAACCITVRTEPYKPGPPQCVLKWGHKRSMGHALSHASSREDGPACVIHSLIDEPAKSTLENPEFYSALFLTCPSDLYNFYYDRWDQPEKYPDEHYTVRLGARRGDWQHFLQGKSFPERQTFSQCSRRRDCQDPPHEPSPTIYRWFEKKNPLYWEDREKESPALTDSEAKELKGLEVQLAEINDMLLEAPRPRVNDLVHEKEQLLDPRGRMASLLEKNEAHALLLLERSQVERMRDKDRVEIGRIFNCTSVKSRDEACDVLVTLSKVLQEAFELAASGGEDESALLHSVIEVPIGRVFNERGGAGCLYARRMSMWLESRDRMSSTHLRETTDEAWAEVMAVGNAGHENAPRDVQEEVNRRREEKAKSYEEARQKRLAEIREEIGAEFFVGTDSGGVTGVTIALWAIFLETTTTKFQLNRN